MKKMFRVLVVGLALAVVMAPVAYASSTATEEPPQLTSGFYTVGDEVQYYDADANQWVVVDDSTTIIDSSQTYNDNRTYYNYSDQSEEAATVTAEEAAQDLDADFEWGMCVISFIFVALFGVAMYAGLSPMMHQAQADRMLIEAAREQRERLDNKS